MTGRDGSEADEWDLVTVADGLDDWSDPLSRVMLQPANESNSSRSFILFYKSRPPVGSSLLKVFFIARWVAGVGIDSYRLEGKRLCLRISTGENVSA